MFLSLGIAAALRHQANHNSIINSEYTRVLLCTNPSSGGNQGGTYLEMGDKNGYIGDRAIKRVHESVYVAPMFLKNSKQTMACGDKAKELLNSLWFPTVGFRTRSAPHFSSRRKLLVIAAGGDGTVQWVIDEVANKVKESTIDKQVVFGILPLGTGNDGSQGLGWGQTSKPDDLRTYLKLWLNSSEEKGIWSRTLEVDIDGALLEPIHQGHKVTKIIENQVQKNETSFTGSERPKMNKVNDTKENWGKEKENQGPWKPTLKKGKLRLTKNFMWYASVGQLEKAGYKFQYSRLEDGRIRQKVRGWGQEKTWNDIIYAVKGASSMIGNKAKDAISMVTLDPKTEDSQEITELGTSVVFLAGRTFAGGMALHEEGETKRSLDNTLLDVRTVGKVDMSKKKLSAVQAGPAASLNFPSLEADGLGTANAGAHVTFKKDEEPVYMQVDGEFVALLKPSEMTIQKHKKYIFLARK